MRGMLKTTCFMLPIMLALKSLRPIKRSLLDTDVICEVVDLLSLIRDIVDA